jgi:hypothetical protein
MKTNVTKKIVADGDFQKYEEGSPQYVDALATAIVKSVNFLWIRLRTRWAKPPGCKSKFFCFYSVAKNLTSVIIRGFRHSKIMTAYFNDKVYSIELVGAVLRQESFVRKMYDLGWTRSGYFDAESDGLALQHALARYHAYGFFLVPTIRSTDRRCSFLDLMSSSPLSFFVPTLDIDLVWHTHQLMPSKYQQDTESYVGRFIDQLVHCLECMHII